MTRPLWSATLSGVPSSSLGEGMYTSTIVPRPFGPSNRLAVIDGRRPVADPPARPIRTIGVLLAHAEPLMRAGLRAVLERPHDIGVTDEAATGEAAVASAVRRRPDVIVMDLRLPLLSGVEAMRRILAGPEPGRPAVLVLSRSVDDETLLTALRAGASGVLAGNALGDDLVGAVRVVAGGGALLPPGLTRRLIEEVAAQPEPPMLEHLDALTAREREVVGLVAVGLTNHEIAERLVVSPATAKTHVSRAMIKSRARDRAKLVALAYQAGWVEPRRVAEAAVADRAYAAPRLAA
jgi:DNA-binding NarL/FixJ family response regulator